MPAKNAILLISRERRIEKVAKKLKYPRNKKNNRRAAKAALFFICRMTKTHAKSTMNTNKQIQQKEL